MRWRDLRRSSNVRDLRGRRAGLGIPLSIGRGKGGLGVILLLVIAAIIGGPELVSQLLGGGAVGTGGQRPAAPAAGDEDGAFTAAILGSTEDVWGALFADANSAYVPPELTLFDGAVQSACGYASSAVGPFYCPADSRVYLDTAFFDDLARMGGPGDFAQAYVIGHEIGHHIQNLTGTAAEVRDAQARAGGGSSANPLQVAMELQADCYAGVWAHHANRRDSVLEPGDVDEGLAAAEAIGDDRLQRNAGRRVTPDSFTHGSSEQRREWLLRGLESGDPGACDTFR
ncbi:MAG: neutral zinc metallopeptidase [Gammaproteobacteria bacterium]|nr:neutral zinc metallopeptidase [Gammaproteobacteria bacterium]